MRLFRRQTDEERAAEEAADERREAARVEAAASLAAIEAGGIPPAAQRRLQAVGAGTQAAPYTSDLSVAGLALLRQRGLRPLTQVMGSSVYKVGWQRIGNQYPGWGKRGFELEAVSAAWNDARRLAFGRLRQEAQHAGADAVVSLQLSQQQHDEDEDTIEIVAFGTAVRRDGAPPAAETALTTLSAGEHWLLTESGYEPLGIVSGSTVYYIVASWRTRLAQGGGFFGGGWQNQELADFTQGVYDARELALYHATQQAQQLGAAGMVGMRIEQSEREYRVDLGNDNEREDLIVTFHVLGTAIGERSAAGRDLPVDTLLSLKRS